MAGSLKKSLFMATLAQLGGVSLALLGCFVLMRKDWPWWRLSGIAIPFSLAYITFIYGLVVCFVCFRSSTPVDEKKYKFFVLLYLYVDASMLPIMVACSGGVKQSLFTPLFFALPAMAVVFVPRSWVWKVFKLPPLNQTWFVTAVTLVGYLVVYWLQYLLPHLFPTAGATAKLFYSICECVILVGSVFLTVLVSRWVPLLR